MTDHDHDHRPEAEPEEPEDRMRTGDAVVLILLALLTAYLIGYGAMHYAGIIVGAPRHYYDGGGADYDAPFWNDDGKENDR